VGLTTDWVKRTIDTLERYQWSADALLAIKETIDNKLSDYYKRDDICKNCWGIGYLTFNTDEGWHNMCPDCNK